MDAHPDDSFHPPSGDDPFWTETCWGEVHDHWSAAACRGFVRELG